MSQIPFFIIALSVLDWDVFNNEITCLMTNSMYLILCLRVSRIALQYSDFFLRYPPILFPVYESNR